MAEKIVNFVLNIKGNASKQASSLSKAVGGVAGVSKLAAAGMVALTGATIAAGAAMFSYQKHIESVVDETNTLAKATGLSNETVAGLRAAAVATGKSLNDLVPKKLSKKILDASMGLTTATRAFDALGISATTANGGLRSTDDVLRDALDALSAIEDPTTKSALAFDLLGKQGQQMLSAFDNTAGLDKFVSQAEKYGVSVGPKAVAEVARFQAANAALSSSFTFVASTMNDTFGLMDIFTAGIIKTTTMVVFSFETLNEVTKQATENRGHLLEANQALTRGDLGGYLDSMAKGFSSSLSPIDAWTDAMDKAGETTDQFLKDHGLAFDSMADQGPQLPTSAGVPDAPEEGGKKFAGKVKEELTGAIDLLELGTLSDDMFAAITDGIDLDGLEEAMASFSLTSEGMLADLADLAFVFESLPEKVIRATGVLSRVGQAVDDPIGELVEAVPFIGALAVTAVDLLLNLDDKLEAIFDGILSLPENLGDSIRRLLVEVIPSFIAALPDLVTDLIVTLPVAIAEGVFQGSIAMVDAVIGLAISIPVAIVEGIANLFIGVWESIKAFFTSLFNPFSEGGILNDIAGGFNNLIGKESGQMKGTSVNGDLQFFGEGGFVDRTGLAVVHEGERVIPKGGAGPGMGGGGGINIANMTVQANDPREFMRQLRTQLGDFGMGESLEAF